MTPRSGLYVAPVGLVMALLCLATLFLLRDWKDPEINGVGDLMIMGTGIGFVLFIWAVAVTSDRNRFSLSRTASVSRRC